MIGPEDIGERKTANPTPTIALSLAAILLLVVGAMSYRDFVRDRLEREYQEKEALLYQRHGITPPDSGAAAPATPAAQPGAPAPGTTVLYDAQGNPVYLSSAPTGPGQGVPAPTSSLPVELPEPEDPEIARLRQSLEAASEQGRRTEQRFNELAGGEFSTTPTNPAAPAAPAVPASGQEPAVTAELPDFLRNAVMNPPGGNPEVEAQVARVRTQVMSAPSLAKVTSYDREWGIVTFDAGASQGVKKDQRFAVRRGADILGWVKVDEVQANEAIAVLVTKNADIETALKPDVGDDLIDFELY